MIDCCSGPGLLPFEQALKQMLDQVEPIAETINLPIESAVNSVLASDIHSPMNVPPHDNSAMDGYAFAASSLTTSLQLEMVGRSMAGAPFKGECLSGQCIRIMTGAKIPQGCDSVEMQENCQADTDNKHITFSQAKAVGSHVRYAGEDINQGQAVLAKGQHLTTVDIGILASLGIKNVSVYRQLTVALIATGDELKSPGETLTEGDIYHSNSFVLSAILEKMNINVIDFGVIADDFQAIRNAFIQADLQADAVISSGGVSVGEADYTKEVLDDLGEIGFWKIAMKPGKPFAFGKLANSIFFGLPGNPVSALVSFHQLAMPALFKQQHAQAMKHTHLKVKTATKLKKHAGRLDFQRAIFSINKQGENTVTSTGAQGSGILSSLARANCYIVLPAEQGNVEAGEWVDVQLFDHYIS